MDSSDVSCFVEQAERLQRLSDDLRRLSRPENHLKILTISEIPSSYGRRDVAHVLWERCQVAVEPRDVVFRFKRWGRQGDTCYVLCPSSEAVDHCVQEIQVGFRSWFGCCVAWRSWRCPSGRPMAACSGPPSCGPAAPRSSRAIRSRFSWSRGIYALIAKGSEGAGGKLGGEQSML